MTVKMLVLVGQSWSLRRGGHGFAEGLNRPLERDRHQKRVISQEKNPLKGGISNTQGGGGQTMSNVTTERALLDIIEKKEKKKRLEAKS